MTDDGSYGEKGLVTNGVEKVIQREKVDLCVTIGPAIMMKFVSQLTKNMRFPPLLHSIPLWSMEPACVVHVAFP